MTDSHLGHAKLLEYGERPENFEQLIVRGIHETPVEQDLLIHLGDVCIGHDEYHHQTLMLPIRSRFKKNVLVRGNHDNKSDAWYYRQGWDFVCRSFSTKIFGKKLLFTHIPVKQTFKTKECSECDGFGYLAVADHHPTCDGNCEFCPVQVQGQCKACEGEGGFQVSEYDFNIHGHLHGGGINSHRIGDVEKYDPSYHIDVAPELRGFAPVKLEKLI